jgi:peptidase A4-like protein
LSGTVTVVVVTPVLNGIGLASVEFNGSTYPNGSQFPPLRSGVNYTFSAVGISLGYTLDHWEVTSGSIVSESNNRTTISFGCLSIPCPQVNLSLSLASLNRGLLSGEAYAVRAVKSFAATFSVPQLSWWKTSKRAQPPPGATEVVDWGVGLGGILGAPTVAVGLQMLLTSNGRGGYTASYQAFSSSSIANYSGRTNFTTNSQSLATLGDTISASANFTPACPTDPTVYISDLNLRSGRWSYQATLANCRGPTFSAGTAEWIAWHPLGSTSLFSPSYNNGNFSQLALNGKPVYPTVPYLCLPLLLCLPATPPAVSFTQWLNAGAGWNESLSGGSVQGLLGPTYFLPKVMTLANVSIEIYPYNRSSESNPLEIEINGSFYPNGAIAHLPNATTLWLSDLAEYQINGYRIGFEEWGTTAGNLSNPHLLYSTLTVSQPGALEALTVDVDTNWAGYVDAVNNSTKLSVGTQFTVPQSIYNSSANASGYEQAIGFWVGIGGDVGPLWQAGIQLNYSPSGVLTLRPWYEYVGPKGGPVVFGPLAYIVQTGNLMDLNVSVCGPPRCGSWYDNWSIVDLNQPKYSGQPLGSGPHENWSGTWPGSTVVDTRTAEWIAESPGATCPSPQSPNCVLPILTMPVNFTGIWVNHEPVNLFGPFQLTQAIYGYPARPSGSFEQFLIPSAEVSQAATSITIQE